MGLTYVSFSKVTVADFESASASESDLISRLVILPLFTCQSEHKWVNMNYLIPEAEEVAYFLLAGGAGNATDVYRGRHFFHF